MVIDFEIFLTIFQSVKPEIHLFFWNDEIAKIAIVAKFVKSKLQYVNNNGVKTIEIHHWPNYS